MFRRTKTVNSVMESFRNTIADLDQIVVDQIDVTAKLSEQRIAINEKIEIADLEIHQARGISDRLNNMVFGSEPSTECSGGCPK